MKIINKIKEIFYNLFVKGFDNVLFNRLDSMYHYFEFCDVESDKLKILDISSNGIEASIHFEFNSNLGPVRLELTQAHLPFVVYSLDYSNYAGSTVFEIVANPGGNTVKPKLGENLMAKDIDLALYEVEQYLQQFGNIIELVKLEQEQEKAKQKLHEKELDKLERGEY